MKKFIMYGAGNIGRGFIGQIFSANDYSVGFIDINKKVIINATYIMLILNTLLILTMFTTKLPEAPKLLMLSAQAIIILPISIKALFTL